MGRYHREEDDLEQAETFLRRAAEAGHPPAAADLGAVLLASSRADEARGWLETALAAGIRQAGINLGILHLLRGEVGAGADLLEDVADLVEGRLATRLASDLANDGDHQRARRWLLRAHERGHEQAALLIGESFLVTGDEADAEHWLRTAWERGVLAAADHLGKLHFHRGEWDAAEPFLRAGAESGSPEAATLLGSLHYQRDELEEAEHWLRKATSAGSRGARLALGVVLLDKSALDEAESVLLDSLSAHEAEAATYLAKVQHQRGDEAGAERWARRALGVRYDSEPALLLSSILMEQRRYDEAVAVLVPGHEAGDPEVTHNLGMATFHRGDLETAVQLFTQAQMAGVPESATALRAIFREITRAAEAEEHRRRRSWWRRRS
ncbi:tetratricopeptide repeat protein [Lentzea guizhouensis]